MPDEIRRLYIEILEYKHYIRETEDNNGSYIIYVGGAVIELYKYILKNARCGKCKEMFTISICKKIQRLNPEYIVCEYCEYQNLYGPI